MEKIIINANINPKLKKFLLWFVRLFGVGRLKKYSWSIIRAGLIIGISFIIIYPILVKVSSSFKSEADLYDSTVIWIPRQLNLENFTLVFDQMRYLSSLWNSIKLSFMATALQLVSCTLVGYGLARFKFWGRSIVFSLVIFTLLVPPQTIMVPLYMHFRFFDLFGIIEAITGSRGVNLMNTYWPFALTAMTCMGIKNGLYIYMIRQYFRGMPKELEEAALVDGAGVFKTFYQVMLPSAVPTLVAVILFSFVWQWNDTFYSSLFWTSTKGLPGALSSLMDNVRELYEQTGRPYNDFTSSMLNNTGSLMVIAPLIILYAFAQRYFVESIERSGLVG